MKKINLVLVLTLLVGILAVPFTVKADDYKSLNFKEALNEEGIELKNSNYKETDDQAIIYMFRGKGCGYCKKFLTFLSNLSNEYGKYFKLVSYEVWYDTNNNTLMQTVASYLKKMLKVYHLSLLVIKYLKDMLKYMMKILNLL